MDISFWNLPKVFHYNFLRFHTTFLKCWYCHRFYGSMLYWLIEIWSSSVLIWRNKIWGNKRMWSSSNFYHSALSAELTTISWRTIEIQLNSNIQIGLAIILGVLLYQLTYYGWPSYWFTHSMLVDTIRLPEWWQVQFGLFKSRILGICTKLHFLFITKVETQLNNLDYLFSCSKISQ